MTETTTSTPVGSTRRQELLEWLYSLLQTRTAVNSSQNQLFAKMLMAAIIAIGVLGISLSNAQSDLESQRRIQNYYNSVIGPVKESIRKHEAEELKRKSEELALKRAERELRTSKKNRKLQKEANKRNPEFVKELKSIIELADSDKIKANLALINFISDNSKYIKIDPILSSQVELVRDHLAPKSTPEK